MYIRQLHDDEYDEVVTLITESVHSVCKNDYSEKELNAWAPARFDINAFRKALSGALNLVALESGKIVGFLSMEKTGYINRLYTHKDRLRCGIASALLDKAFAWAIENGIFEITLDSSKTAEGFYIKKGFDFVGISVMRHNDVVLKSSVMRKFL